MGPMGFARLPEGSLGFEDITVGFSALLPFEGHVVSDRF